MYGRRILVLLAAVAAALVLAACAEVREQGGGQQGGGEGQQGPIELAVVPKAVGFDFWETVREGAVCAARRAEGEVDVQWDGVAQETDVTGQVNLLQNFITQGVDGLVYAATDARVLHDVTRQALDQGITVVNIDSGTDPQPENVPVFATDNVAAAERATEYLVEQLGPDGGKVAFIPFQPGTATNDTRTQGFKNVLEENPQVELVAEQSSESNYNRALQVTEDILTAHPDLDAIYAANEPGVLGAAEAVRSAGKAGEIIIVGWDTAPDELKAVREGVVSALIAQNPFRMGYDGVNAAVRMIRTGEQVEGGDTGAILVTKENIDDPEVQRVLKPSCENPPVEDQ
ncbi:ABC transporter substrate-binding protein [Rubrobacter xylanophilus]|uniref:ABC transporter substrate-binding protein n=1 Tax=Rubrobacter xylanophilus TaxID=49319 RepID=A0A510HL42_9ACTN|nr:substrate-binding domain-containing protein [Rubrobacter xylanophilus]BBL80682.1 ABC transporter substrate-binding protein [Rubrobacter xylanophilus]